MHLKFPQRYEMAFCRSWTDSRSPEPQVRALGPLVASYSSSLSHICTFCQPHTGKAILTLLFAFSVSSERPLFMYLVSFVLLSLWNAPFPHSVVFLLVSGTLCVGKTAPPPPAGVADRFLPGHISPLSFFRLFLSCTLPCTEFIKIFFYAFFGFWNPKSPLEMLHLSSLKLQRNPPMFHSMGALWA